MKTCCSCKESKPLSEFGPSAQRKDGLRPVCKKCHREANARWRAKNPEKARASCSNWARTNREKANEKMRRWVANNQERMAQHVARYQRENQEAIRERLKQRRQIPEVRMMRAIGQRIRSYVAGKDYASTAKLVGYSGGELRAHLERQFLHGMDWSNYGEWHIDHIVPLSSFTITSPDDPELRRAWALPNLRPLWARDNIVKRDKRTHLI